MHVLPNNAENCFVMLASSIDNKEGGKNPFWYAQVLLIMHMNARYVTNSIQNATIFAGYGGLAQKQGMKADRLSNDLIKSALLRIPIQQRLDLQIQLILSMLFI